jgi:integrase
MTDKFDLNDRKLQAEIKKALPEGTDRRTIWDTNCNGLAVRIGLKGAKAGKATFFAVKRLKGEDDAQPRWHRIGQYPTTSLAEARDEARAALRLLDAGTDPKKKAEEERAAEEEKRKAVEEAERKRVANGFATVVERWAEHYRTTTDKRGTLRRRAEDAIKTVKKELVGAWGDRPITDITEDDIIALIETIKERGSHNAARHAFAACRLVFKWARQPRLDADKRVTRIISVNPTAELKPSELYNKASRRDRFLKDDELRRVWDAAGSAGIYGKMIRLLILTGCRRDEIGAARWSEVDLDNKRLVVPASRMKMKLGHSVPLTQTALDILSAMHRFDGGDHIFSASGERPLGNYNRGKRRLDALTGPMPAWVVHDIRRTVRTGLSSLKLEAEIAERVIGHTPADLRARYDLHRYDGEKLEALRKWEAHVLSLVAPEPPADDAGNVVSMRRKA